MEPSQRWRIWDFGTCQFVSDCVTGSCAKVFGDGGWDGGPFSLLFFDGEPVLAGEGDDDTKALHVLSDMAKVRTELVEPPGTSSDFKVTDPDHAPPDLGLLSQLQEQRKELQCFAWCSIQS